MDFLAAVHLFVLCTMVIVLGHGLGFLFFFGLDVLGFGFGFSVLGYGFRFSGFGYLLFGMFGCPSHRPRPSFLR